MLATPRTPKCVWSNVLPKMNALIRSIAEYLQAKPQVCVVTARDLKYGDLVDIRVCRDLIDPVLCRNDGRRTTTCKGGILPPVWCGVSETKDCLGW